MIINEREIYPYETSDLSGKNCLVIAPHPDDESIGCGGSILRHTKRGSSVRVIFLSKGEGGDFRGVFGEGYVNMRQESAVKALSALGVKDYEFWECKDRRLYQERDSVFKKVKGELDRFNPSLLYVPSPYEAHPDHRAAASAVWQIYQEIAIPVAFYEVLMPLYPDILIDITDEFKIKESAIKCYQTELFYNDYLNKIEGLNRFRTATLPAGIRYAEAFVLFGGEKKETPAQRLLKSLIIDREKRE